MKVRKVATTVASPARAVRDTAREAAIKGAVALIVFVAGKAIKEEKINQVLNWEKTYSFTLPTDKKLTKWLSEKDTHSTLIDLINQGLQMPLALYGVTPLQIEATPTEEGHLKVQFKLKAHKNSELK